MTDFVNSLNNSLLINIKKDYNNLFHSIVFKYGHLNPELTIESLQKKYEINKIYSLDISNNNTNITQHKNHKIPIDNKRCLGRVWNNGKVTLNTNGNLIFGDQCKRTKQDESDFCGIHNKSLTHGRIDLDPPHKHFEKFIKN
jgi:hypothetical protein